MKTVYLFRHAHAEAAESMMDDHDRTLSARGEAEAENAGLFLTRNAHRPALVLCSSSVRTVQTMNIALGNVRQKTSRALYLAAQEDILDEIQKTDNAHDSVMIIGHNPGIGELAALLAGKHSPVMAFSPAALAVFKCACEKWEDLGAHNARLVDFFTP